MGEKREGGRHSSIMDETQVFRIKSSLNKPQVQLQVLRLRLAQGRQTSLRMTDSCYAEPWARSTRELRWNCGAARGVS